MTYKLLSVSKKQGYRIGINIGDYIQALAASQFYPHIDGFLDRDEDLAKYVGQKCKIIMNGWYMHNPNNWPPSEMIDPLFVALHINSLAKETMLSEKSIEYFKNYEPRGCREYYTMNLLKDKGIDAYFSGCMTLTLGNKFKTEEKEDKTYIVDPIYDGRMTFDNFISALIIWLLHPIDVLKLLLKKHLHIHSGRNIILKLMKVALYYKEYSRLFGRDIVINSTYICQEHIYYAKKFPTEEARLEEADRLVRLYSKASFVITSRIHCALPCLGLDTPVIYLERSNDTVASSCRMNGLKDLFNVVKVNRGILEPLFETKLPINKGNYPLNKSLWKEFAKNLEIKCKDFILGSEI